MGGAPSIPQRNLTSELGQLFGQFPREEQLFHRFAANEPLLSGAQDFALLARWVGQHGQRSSSGSLEDIFNTQLLPILQSGGALTPEQEGDVQRRSYAQSAELGNLHSPGAVGSELLNRDQYRQQRFNQALSQSQGLASGVLGNLTGTESAETGNFSALMSPLLGFGQDLFSSNQNASAAQSIAGANKTGGITSGITSAVGSIAAAY